MNIINAIKSLPYNNNNSSFNVVQRFLHISISNLVKIGDQLPDVDLYEDLPSNKINLSQFAKGKKIILFGVPGAFTPGCSKTHLPGFINKSDLLKKQGGIDEIICVSVNDPFVMGAWSANQNAKGKVKLLADPAGVLAKTLNLAIDIPPLGGLRSKRYSLVAENGKIVSLQVEPDGTGLSCSLADKIKI